MFRPPCISTKNGLIFNRLFEGNNSLSKTGPLKANKDIAGATDKKSQTTAKRDYEKSYSKRSLSFTNISNISPKSPYLDEEDDRPRTHVVDSASLREQIYYDWLKKKDSHMKTKVIKKKQSEKEKEEEAEREKQDKKIMVSTMSCIITLSPFLEYMTTILHKICCDQCRNQNPFIAISQDNCTSPPLP